MNSPIRRPRKKETRPRNRTYPTGAEHPRWLGGTREKTCSICGTVFRCVPPMTYATFRCQQFCSRECGWKGQRFLRGSDNPQWKPDARRRNRGGPHSRWRNMVIARDVGICQRCGANGVELHAHHVKAYKDFPELRFDIANGETLCFRCHWAEHTALPAKAVKSGDTLPERSGDNPEPSERGNLLEGVTTSGRAYRRIVQPCDWCGTTISKSLSDARGKMALFCGKRCMGKWMATRRGFNVKPMAVTSTTSAAPERDDIV